MSEEQYSDPTRGEGVPFNLTEEELTDSPLADTVNLGDIEWEYLEQWVNRETVPLPIVHAICFGVAEQLIKNRKANDE